MIGVDIPAAVALRASFRADRSGSALIEFTLTVPILALLFLGGFQLMDAISCYRKVTATVRTLADLTTQNTDLTTGQADDILNASRQVMTPFSTTTAVLRITQVKIPANNMPVVDWSRAINGTAYSKGASVTVPTAIKQANTFIIYSEIVYTYTPRLASGFIGTIPFRDQIFMSPRNSASVTCSTCP